jgi:hypothetical protein
MPRNPNCGAESPRKHRLSLTQLASYDDVLTDALIDQVDVRKDHLDEA